jgi:SAM-dependent methyltransferase
MHEHSTDSADDEPAIFWEERYRSGRQWSGEPNALLVEEVDGLTAGTALDLGCGEGGDAIWLAQQGWQVTAVDIAAAALALGAEHAGEAGVAQAITWEQHDLASSFPEGVFGLVSASYLHSPVELARSLVLRRAADAVEPDGHLVVVGHAGPPSWSTPDHPYHDVVLPAPDEVLADLDLPEVGWEVVRQATVDRAAPGPDGLHGTRPDNVLHLRRRT